MIRFPAPREADRGLPRRRTRPPTRQPSPFVMMNEHGSLSDHRHRRLHRIVAGARPAVPRRTSARRRQLLHRQSRKSRRDSPPHRLPRGRHPRPRRHALRPAPASTSSSTGRDSLRAEIRSRSPGQQPRQHRRHRQRTGRRARRQSKARRLRRLILRLRRHSHAAQARSHDARSHFSLRRRQTRQRALHDFFLPLLRPRNRVPCVTSTFSARARIPHLLTPACSPSSSP